MSLKSFFSSPSPKIPIARAIFWIVLSTLCISPLSYHGVHYFLNTKQREKEETISMISYIVQTGPQREALHSDYLAELMSLSSDQPTPFSQFNSKRAEESLKSIPVIQEAHVKKIKPNIVYVDYTVRQPIAWIYDYQNIAIDKEGFLFPVYPFFSPKNLPEIYLGMRPFGEEDEQGERGILGWHQPFRGKYIELAFSILYLLQEHGSDLFTIKRIDVSQAFADSYGKREIIVVIENDMPLTLNTEDIVLKASHVLRLNTTSYSKELANYLTLRASLLDKEKKEALQNTTAMKAIKEKVIDLRISQLAFIE